MATMEMGRPIEELRVHDSSAIENWLERFEMMIEVNPVYSSASDADKPAKKRAMLLSLIGAEGYSLLKAYLAPEPLNVKTYDELKESILTNLAPKTSVVSESYRISTLKHETAETLSIFMSRIKQCAIKCDFGNNFDRMVRDKFICGIRSEKLRAKLISDSSITTSALALSKAIDHENSQNAAHVMNINSVRYARVTQNKPVGNNNKTIIKIISAKIQKKGLLELVNHAPNVRYMVILHQTVLQNVDTVKK